MHSSRPQQRCCPPVAGHTLRADCDGGAFSSDFGPLLLRGIDRQMGLTERLAAAVHAQRHPSYIDHALRERFAPRLYPIASGYADGHDAKSRRHDPMFQLGVDRLPWETAQDLARAPTCSRFEPQVARKDLYRLTTALVAHLMASSAEPPAAIVLDREHSDDPTHGQQDFAF
jgi:Transposase DDE domain group 1